jgi:hypothetical protein
MIQIVETFIRTLIQSETGLVTIRSRQASPRPPLPYATYLFVNPSSKPNGQDEIRDVPNNEDDFTQNGLRQSLVSINIFGENANNRMSDLRDALDRPDIISLFCENNLSVVGNQSIQDLTSLEDTRYVERSQMDLQIYYSINKDARAVPVEAVEVTAFNSTIEINKGE